MEFLFNPFFQCFVEMSKIFFNYSVPVFDVPLYVFLTLPLVFKILLIPISVSGKNLRSKDAGAFSYLSSRLHQHVKDDYNKKGGD